MQCDKTETLVGKDRCIVINPCLCRVVVPPVKAALENVPVLYIHGDFPIQFIHTNCTLGGLIIASARLVAELDTDRDCVSVVLVRTQSYELMLSQTKAST